jgi:hypothetical protein
VIVQVNDLKKRIDKKEPNLIVSKSILSKPSGQNNSPWVDVGFMGLAGIVEIVPLFVMSFFSSKWNKAYVQKKLQYRYSMISEDERSVTFKLS